MAEAAATPKIPGKGGHSSSSSSISGGVAEYEEKGGDFQSSWRYGGTNVRVCVYREDAKPVLYVDHHPPSPRHRRRPHCVSFHCALLVPGITSGGRFICTLYLDPPPKPVEHDDDEYVDIGTGTGTRGTKWMAWQQQCTRSLAHPPPTTPQFHVSFFFFLPPSTTTHHPN